MNVSCMYLNHIGGFRDVDPKANTSKYSTNMWAITGDNGQPIAISSSYRYIIMFNGISPTWFEVPCRLASLTKHT